MLLIALLCSWMLSFNFSMFGWVFVDSSNFVILALDFKSMFSYLRCSVCKFLYQMSLSAQLSLLLFLCSFSILLFKSFCALDWVTISLLKSSCLGETFFIFVGILYNPLSVFSVSVLLSSFKRHVSLKNSWFFACCSLCSLLSKVWFSSRVLLCWWFLFWVSFPFWMLLASCPFLMLLIVVWVVRFACWCCLN